MGEKRTLKIDCINCGVGIEFGLDLVGQFTKCPTCGLQVELHHPAYLPKLVEPEYFGEVRILNDPKKNPREGLVIPSQLARCCWIHKRTAFELEGNWLWFLASEALIAVCQRTAREAGNLFHLFERKFGSCKGVATNPKQELAAALAFDVVAETAARNVGLLAFAALYRNDREQIGMFELVLEKGVAVKVFSGCPTLQFFIQEQMDAVYFEGVDPERWRNPPQRA